jgi:hypothetical protein
MIKISGFIFGVDRFRQRNNRVAESIKAVKGKSLELKMAA